MREKLLSLPFENFDLLEGKLLVATLEQETSWVIYVCAHDRKEDFIGGFITNEPLGELVFSAISEEEATKNDMRKISSAANLLKLLSNKITGITKNLKQKSKSYININKNLYNVEFNSQISKEPAKNTKNVLRLPILEGGPVDTLIAVTTCQQETAKNTKKKNLTTAFKEEALYKVDIHLDIFKFLKNFFANRAKFDRVILVSGLTIWDKEQLAAEIKTNQWLIIEPHVKDIFAYNSQDLWGDIVKNTNIIDRKFMATYAGNC